MCVVRDCVYFLCNLDRLVILGNHRDAWVFGAADPNSGTAVMMELARALSELRAIGKYRIAGKKLRGPIFVYCTAFM